MKGKSKKAEGEILQLWMMKVWFFDGNRQSTIGNRFLVFAFCLFTFAFCFPLTAWAQPEDELEIAPPPIKAISKEESQQLEAEPNVKKHTQLALNLMEARLKTAETQTTENNYPEALKTLGGFQILLEKTLGFLSKNDTESDKVQNNFKRLELSLRGQVARLEILRRAMPSRFAYYVQKLIKTVRDARSKAVEPLFGDSVVPERKPK
jgi:hypothetical protein